MAIQQTSMEAYLTVDKETRYRQILRQLSKGPCANFELSKWLDLPINCITGRITELVELGKVQRCGIKKGPSGRRVIIWERVY